MNHQVASVLSESLRPLYDAELVTVLAGLVLTATVKQKDGNTVKFPVPFGHEQQPNQISNDALIPDSKQRAIIYFEGNDSSTISSNAEKSKMQSNMRLICWYNLDKFQTSNRDSVHVSLLTRILGLLHVAGKQSDDLRALTVVPGRVLDSTAQLFSRYSYQQERGQYLQNPYYAFGIDLTINYQINHHCHGDLLPVNTAGCC